MNTRRQSFATTYNAELAAVSQQLRGLKRPGAGMFVPRAGPFHENDPMIDWLAARSLWSPAQATRRRIKKWGADRQALVREGSEAVTPVIQLAQEVGPVGVMWGTSNRSISASWTGR
jgi:hypothetical protein